MVKLILTVSLGLAAAASLLFAVLEAPGASAATARPPLEPLVMRPLSASLAQAKPTAKPTPAPTPTTNGPPSPPVVAAKPAEPAPAPPSVADAGTPSPAAVATRPVPAPTPATSPAPAPAPAPTPTPASPPRPAPAAAAVGDGQLNLRASDTADVYLDGKKLGSSPLVGVKAKAGNHKVRFDCYDAAGNTVAGQVKVVTVAANEELDVDYPCPESE